MLIRFYRGERCLKGWPTQVQRLNAGFTASQVSREVNVEAVIEHIIMGTNHTPFVSVTTSLKIASRYATDKGVVYHLKLPDGLTIINPCSVLNEWLVTNGFGKSEEVLRAREALKMAEEEAEWLIVGHIPGGAITAVKPASKTIW